MDIPVDKPAKEPIILHVDLENIELVDLASLFEIACQNEQYAEAAIIRKAINRNLDAIEARCRNPEEEEDEEEDDDEHFLPDPEF